MSIQESELRSVAEWIERRGHACENLDSLSGCPYCRLVTALSSPPSGIREAEQKVIEAAKAVRYAYFSAGRGKKFVPDRMMDLADAISVHDLASLAGTKEGA